MNGVVFERPGAVAHTRVADARLERDGDALVRVRLAGICGSDLHVYRGKEVGLDAGTVMGHELLGEVVEVGREVSGFRPGDLVVSPFSTSCGNCFYCARGLTARCERGELFGWVAGGRGLPGVQAELARVPLADTTLVRVPAGADPIEALLAGDVLATGWQAAEGAGATAGAAIAVVGCGPVGCMAVVAARRLGAERVLACDAVAERLELARAFGAEPVDVAAGNAIAVVRDATAGRGADGVVEAVGTPEATRLAFELVRSGGAIAAVGVHTEERLAFSPGEAYDKNLIYRAGRCSARAGMDRLLPLLARGPLGIGRIVSHRLPLAEGPRGYELFDRRLDGCTKVVLEP